MARTATRTEQIKYLLEVKLNELINARRRIKAFRNRASNIK
jgi:hypothetical protein